MSILAIFLKIRFYIKDNLIIVFIIYLKVILKMFIMLPCPTVTDNVGLQALGDLAKKIPQLN